MLTLLKFSTEKAVRLYEILTDLCENICFRQDFCEDIFFSQNPESFCENMPKTGAKRTAALKNMLFKFFFLSQKASQN
jgi:hypothetical protein